jgi:carboxylesterase
VSKGALLIHGLTSTPLEVVPLRRTLEQAGWQVKAPCLPGHGATVKELARATEHDWTKVVTLNASELTKSTGASIAIIGCSMGALLALQYALRFPNKVDRLVLLAPPLQLRGSFVERVCRFGQYIPTFLAQFLPARKKKLSIEGRLVLPYESLQAYPMSAVFALIRLRGQVLRSEPKRLPCPTLLAYDPNDHLCESKSFTHNPWASDPQLVMHPFPGGEHELLVGPQNNEVTKAIMTFLRG